MDRAEAQARVAVAWSRRAPIAAQRRLGAVRAVNGPADGAPAGLSVDRYRLVSAEGDEATWLVVSAREAVTASRVETWSAAAAEALAAEGVVLKRLARPVARSTSEVIAGALPVGPRRVQEGDAWFWVALDDGVSTGLFLDQRETRFAARAHAPGAEVLNLFSYSGAFSVHAALAGARRVTSVDSARRAHQRARANMTASGLDPDLHRWFADDVLEHLARQSRRGPAYDLLILDPPVFGRAEGRPFALLEDARLLLDGAVASLRPGGVLFFSSHALELAADDLLALARERAAAAGRSLEELQRLGLPAWDHPTAAPRPAGDRGDYLKTLVLRLA